MDGDMSPWRWEFSHRGFARDCDPSASANSDDVRHGHSPEAPSCITEARCTPSLQSLQAKCGTFATLLHARTSLQPGDQPSIMIRPDTKRSTQRVLISAKAASSIIRRRTFMTPFKVLHFVTETPSKTQLVAPRRRHAVGVQASAQPCPHRVFRSAPLPAQRRSQSGHLHPRPAR